MMKLKLNFNRFFKKKTKNSQITNSAKNFALIDNNPGAKINVTIIQSFFVKLDKRIYSIPV